MRMRQLDVRRSFWRHLGALWQTVQQTIGLFSIFMMGITLFGFYNLVYFRYFPNLWVFVGILVAAFAVLMVFTYIVLIPAMYTFGNNQHWTHDNPLRVEVEALREDVRKLLERKE